MWKEKSSQAIKLPHKEVPEWIPGCEAGIVMATDHKGTTESADSDQTGSPAWSDQSTQAQNTPAESLIRALLSWQQTQMF